MNLNKLSRIVLLCIMATVSTLSLTGCGLKGNPVSDDHIFALAVQGDGKIVAVGDSYNSGGGGWKIALMRFNSDGSLDSGFGSGGKVQTPVYGSARAVAIDASGRIVVGGAMYDGSNAFVLARYNTDGTLDATFGSNGGVVFTLMNGGINALAIQSDGSIVAAGNAYSYNGYSNGNDFALARYLSSGILDPTFGAGRGVVITDTRYYATTGNAATGVVLQPDGRIVAAGGPYLIRYNFDGSLDASFGSSGVVLGSQYDWTDGVGVQADGRIVAAGSSYNYATQGYDFAVTRYDLSGNPDTTFNLNGYAVTTLSSLYPLSPAVVVPDTSGKIVAAGYSQYQAVITRSNSDGSSDTTFDADGSLVLPGNLWGSNSMVHKVAVQSDGKLLVAGTVYIDDKSGYDFALQRLNSNGSPDTGFGSNGIVTAGW